MSASGVWVAPKEKLDFHCKINNRSLYNPTHKDLTRIWMDTVMQALQFGKDLGFQGHTVEVWKGIVLAYSHCHRQILNPYLTWVSY